MDKQLELFTNNWGINSGFKNLADQLNDLLPFQGKVQFARSKNKQLEKFRKAQNLLHDLFKWRDSDMAIREFKCCTERNGQYALSRYADEHKLRNAGYPLWRIYPWVVWFS